MPELWFADRIDWRDRQSWKALGHSGGGKFVYRLYGCLGNLLYVGVTWNPFVRWTFHARTKSWWPQVRGAVVFLCADEHEARSEETAAIRDETPAYNKHLRRGA